MGVLASAQMRGVSRGLRRAPGALRGRMRRHIVAAVQPMKQQVQSNALAIPSEGHGHTGLRAGFAAATRVQVRAGARVSVVRLMVDGARMPAGQGVLPDKEEHGGWRHPVQGHRDRWVTQQNHPFFAKAIPPHLPGVMAGVQAAVSETAAELASGR